MSSDRSNDPSADIERHVAEIEPHLIAVRRDIHAHPEIGVILTLSTSSGIIIALYAERSRLTRIATGA